MSDAPHPDWTRGGRDWPNRAASTFHRVGPIAWHVQRMGAGPTLLLLHGAGGATHSWRGLMPLLAERFDVIAPDLPGHGFTRAPGGGAQSLPAMAASLHTLLEALDARPAVMVGHSAGAALAIRMAADGPTRPQALIGLNAALTPFRGMAGVLFPPMAKALALNPLTPWAFAQMAGWSAQAKRLIEGTGSRLDAEGYALYAKLLGRADHVSGALAMMAQWDLAPLARALPALDTPLHLIVGLNDRAVPPDEARRLAAAHPRITLYEVAALGHLMHEEDPGAIARLIRDAAAG